MTQTQLASMFLGKPHTIDDIDNSGANGGINMIHIVDGQTHEILDYITLDNIIEDNHKKSLENTLETYDAIVLGDKRYNEHLEKRNRVIIPDEDGTLREFVLFEIDKYRDTEGLKTHFYSHASYLELKKANIVYPDKHESLTASQLTGIALNETGWTVGIIEAEGSRTIEIENHTNPYEFLKRIANEFDVELRFRIEHNGRRITGRYVDLLEQIGEWRGREIEFGRDLDGIRRVEEQDIVTALLGIGPEREDGTRIEVLVEDEDALRRWGRVDEYGELHHLIEPYEIQSDNQEMTKEEARQYTRTALDKRINTQVSYETTVVDLENVPGMENKKIRFGDTIRIKDTEFNPPLYLEARVYEMTRSIKSKAKKEIKLGEYVEFTEEEVHAIWLSLRAEIRKKIGMDILKDYAEPKKIESDTPPEIKDGENPIWVDTSRTPKVSHVVVAGEWQKMTPTTPEEVDAYTTKQVDDEAKRRAEQALKDAKAFAKNADNIEEGVIDVNAIPLRTSKTGARLEWDGVNGLVQYDSNGDAVSWLDLDANAHFANAFLSGRVEAEEGYFGDNIRIRDGAVEIVRSDGAVSMRDGMIQSGYVVQGSFPPFMSTFTVDIPQWKETFPVFAPGARYGGGFALSPTTSNHIMAGIKGLIDGRGADYLVDGAVSDSRDSMSAVAVQRYYFVHSSRYLAFAFAKYSGAEFSVHVMKNASDNIED